MGKKIYSKGKHFNEYPYDILVSIVARKFYGVENRNDLKILDLGCGAGNNTKFLAEQGFSVCGIDGSSTAIKFAKQKLNEEGLEGRVELTVGDFNKLPYKNNKFDCIIDRESIYANSRKDIKNIISNEVYRVLKEGGIFINFIFSTGNSQKEYGEKIDKSTYKNFEKGTFLIILV